MLVMNRHLHSLVLAGLALAATAAAGCGSDSTPAAKTTTERPRDDAGGVPQALVGTYAVTLDASDLPDRVAPELRDGGPSWTVTIAAKGGVDDGPSFTIASAKPHLGPLESSTPRVNGDAITLKDQACAATGTMRFVDNQYGYRLAGEKLTLTAVDNKCADKIAETILTSRPLTRQADAAALLMRDGEEPGFRRVERVVTEVGVAAFAETNRLSAADVRRLRRDGFVSITVQPIDSPDASGVTNVQVFKTAKGARDWMKHDLRTDVIRDALPGAKIRRFTVAGIPGARGWTAPTPDGQPVANVQWIQGRCMMVLGNQGPGPLAGPLGTGARAIYQRTQGQCP
jgi:hypothetical protein